MSGMALDDDRVQAFLTDLLALTNRHRIGFDSCGCSGSPWLVELAEPLKALSLSKQRDGEYDCLGTGDGGQIEVYYIEKCEGAGETE